MQAESVRLFTALGSAEGAKWVQHHRSIVERFGRFLHRNAGRVRRRVIVSFAILGEKRAAGQEMTKTVSNDPLVSR